MTREELKEHCQRQIQQFERVEKIMPVTPNNLKRYEEHKLVLELLEQEHCDDAISRQAVNTLVDELARAISDERCHMPRGRSTATIMQDILDLPPVNPQEPKTGHWIRVTNGAMREKYICSECGRQIEDDGIEGLLSVKYPYCHCGAKMESEG